MSTTHLPPEDAPRRSSASTPLESTGEFAPDEQAVKLVQVLDQYLDDLRAGRPASREQLIAAHPDLAADLEACLAGLEFIHAAESPLGGASRQLGDFRIIREVGRGGMGAVFEAEQISLGRRVALKILRFGAVADPAAVERFQREAETVAKLHHTNIVPIFAVGTERGVNYYAMQFIEGRSLAEVLAASKGPLAASQVAEWGLQAAEALAHAHQRGVIHRDVKPSNLLVDREQRLWLTDFGLARRLDDVTLSLTGALLGTPRYMSPEQAAASKRRVDHRSDLFSLGATLYELLTGQPAFRGDTPHDVIQNILTSEPTPIRQLVRGAPRDLETIVMKCLAKAAGERYGAAGELAADLRAQLDGRPIRARRASPLEHARRWFQRHQKSAALTGTAALATLAVTLAALVGWSAYAVWRQSSLRLDAASPPLVAEILDSQGQVVRVDTLPMQTAADLPAGEYAVRVSADKTLSQTWEVALTRGHDSAYKINLHDQLLTLPIEVERSFDVVNWENHQALVLWNRDGIAFRNLAEPAHAWSADLAGEGGPVLEAAPGFVWPWSSPRNVHSGYGAYAYQPWLVPESIDIDGDGTRDIVCAGRHQAWLLALSGSDGKLLWIAPRGAQVAEPRRPDWQLRIDHVASAALDRPLWGPDCDGDGVPDLVATFVDVPASRLANQNRVSPRCWVECVSAATGKTLWSYDLPARLFELPPGEEAPYDLRWFVGGDGGNTSIGRASMLVGRHISRDRPHVARTGPHAYRPSPPSLVSVNGQLRIGLVAGRHLLWLDPVTGQALEEPLDLGVRPGKSPRWADVDRDGSADLVLLGERPGAGAIPTAEVAVWSSAARKLLWSQVLDAFWPERPAWSVDAPEWPLVADLTGDGAPEVVVPQGRSRGAGAFGGRLGSQETPWGTLAVLSGDTGTELWSRKIVSMDSQVDAFLAGPDIDGDGAAELFVVTLAGQDFTVSVDALSGKSGKLLWMSRHTPRPGSRGSNAGYVLAPPQWWPAGRDGWPQLVVQVVDDHSGERESLTCAFSAGTGVLAQHGYGVAAVRPADLDGDGLADLALFSSSSADRADDGGTLQCLRGLAAQPWKRLGALGAPAADLDGDGVLDFVDSWGDGALLAASGASGRSLWRSTAIRSTSEAAVQAAGARAAAESTGDLDGDGIVDLLVCERAAGGRGMISPLHAVSGRSGKKLWTASEVNVRVIAGTLALESRDLDGDGSEEVLWLAAFDHQYPARQSFSTSDVQLWLFVLSGRTGRIQWSQPLSPAYGITPGSNFPYTLHNARFSLGAGDLDGDGVEDVLVPAVLADATLELRALSGQTGNLLWRRPRSPDGHAQQALENWISPTVCDLDGDGQSEVVVVEPASPGPAGAQSAPEINVAALEGRTGDERWSKPTGIIGGFWFRAGGPNQDQEPYRPVPLRIRDGRGNRIGVMLFGNGAKLLVLAADGSFHERKIKESSQARRIWACNAMNNGHDDILLLDEEGLLLAAADEPEKTLWKYPLRGAGQCRILAVEPRREGTPPTIVLATGPTDNSVLGIDAASGRRLWTCPGPIPRDLADGVYLTPQRIDLLGRQASRPDALPLVAYTFGSVVDCRQGAAIPASGRGLRGPSRGTAAAAPMPVASWAEQGVAVVRPQLGGIDADPRWKRDLPWRPELDMRAGEILQFLGWGLFFALAMVVIPAVYVVRLVLIRRFNLQTWLALPAIAGIVLTAALLEGPLENDFRTVAGRWTIGLMLAPPIVGTGLLAWWLMTGRWRRAALWIGIVLLISALSAAIMISVSFGQSPLLPEESLDWTGWYAILATGAYTTSWLALAAWPVEAGIRRWCVWLSARQSRRRAPLGRAAAAGLGPFADERRAAPAEATLPQAGPPSSQPETTPP